MNFTRIGPKGQDLPATAKRFTVRRDEATGLWWTDLSPKEMDAKETDAWVKGLDLCGFTDWRLPTLQERLAIVDYSRYSPALDVAAFGDKHTSGWERTSTVYAPDSGFRWCVDLHYGYPYDLHHGDAAFARAVRSGQ